MFKSANIVLPGTWITFCFPRSTLCFRALAPSGVWFSSFHFLVPRLKLLLCCQLRVHLLLLLSGNLHLLEILPCQEVLGSFLFFSWKSFIGFVISFINVPTFFVANDPSQSICSSASAVDIDTNPCFAHFQKTGATRWVNTKAPCDF